MRETIRVDTDQNTPDNGGLDVSQPLNPNNVIQFKRYQTPEPFADDDLVDQYPETQFDDGEDEVEYEPGTPTTVDGLQHFFNETSKVPLLTAVKEIQLAKRIERGDDRAKDEMTVANLRLVSSIAKHYWNPGRGLELTELVNEGTTGLMKAVEKFDWRLGYKFSTYATWWIHQAITRAIANQELTIRLPVHVIERGRRINRFCNQFSAENKRQPTLQEISVGCSLTTEQVEAIREASSVSTSLDKPRNEIEEDSTLHNILADPDSSSPFDLSDDADELYRAMRKLPPRECKVLELRFGLADESAHTLDEIGLEFGVSRERIRQIEAKALTILREAMDTQR